MFDEIENAVQEIVEDVIEDTVQETVEDAVQEIEETPVEIPVQETGVDVTETETPAIDETVFSEEEISEDAGLQGETAEPITDIETVEDIAEEADAETEPSDTPVIEEAVVPSYIAHASEIGTRENPIRANGGEEVFIPTLLRQ